MENNNREEVRKIAQLAMLELEEHELDSIAVKFSEVKHYIDTLNEIDLSDKAPMTNDEKIVVYREDQSKCSGIVAKDFSPFVESNLFVVPKVIE